MGNFLWRQAELISVINVAVASPNDQVNRWCLLRPEREVKSIVPQVVALQHLRLQELHVFVDVLAAANLDLRPVSDQFAQFLLGSVFIVLSFELRHLADQRGHHGRTALVDASEWRDFIILNDVLNKVDVAAMTGPIEVPRLCFDILILLDVLDCDPLEMCRHLQLNDLLRKVALHMLMDNILAHRTVPDLTLTARDAVLIRQELLWLVLARPLSLLLIVMIEADVDDLVGV